jgi:hypothetical protein
MAANIDQPSRSGEAALVGPRAERLIDDAADNQQYCDSDGYGKVEHARRSV